MQWKIRDEHPKNSTEHTVNHRQYYEFVIIATNSEIKKRKEITKDKILYKLA